MAHFFTIITVVYNDAWALSKTIKSIFSQSFNDFELIIVDGMSSDHAPALVHFWMEHGLVSRYIREADNGVYDAMNKGVLAATGDYIVFMNSGDVFFSTETLAKVHKLLSPDRPDGLLGWGQRNDQVWSSWIANDAFRMASLGFCHQALYLKRSLFVKHAFDSRPFKTDSDTAQLAAILEENKILLHPEVLAVRSGDIGISGDLDRTKVSIIDTIISGYKDISPAAADIIIEFRRNCANPGQIFRLLGNLTGKSQYHLSLLVLDTLFLRPSKSLDDDDIRILLEKSIDVLEDNEGKAEEIIENYLRVNRIKIEYIDSVKKAEAKQKAEIQSLRQEVDGKFKAYAPGPKSSQYCISLTSFPSRIASVHLVVESLVRQTRPPERIYLNLGMDELPNANWLPLQLRELQKQGLVLNFVPKTMHQYDKYLHVYKELNGIPLVMVDDDVVYPPKAMEYLLDMHEMYPDLIIANRAHKMSVDSLGRIDKYENWKKEVYENYPGFSIFPTGAGGVLYPCSFFDGELVCNQELILRHAPYADDIWLKACSIARGIRAVCSDMINNEAWCYGYTPLMDEGSLDKTNIDKGLNDAQIKTAFNYLCENYFKNWNVFRLEQGNAGV